MKGVEILTSYEVVIEYAFNWTAFWIVFSVLFGLTIILAINKYKEDKKFSSDLFSMCFSLTIIACAFGALLGSYPSKPEKYETRYKVVLSNEVSMNEFVEKYEILEQNGKLFTIREIE